MGAPPDRPNAALQYYQAALELLNYYESYNLAGFARVRWIIDHAEETPLDHWVAKMVHGRPGEWAGLGHPLSYLHRGTKADYCDWGVPWKEQGLGACTPHIEQMFPVAKAAMLRARWYFQEDNPKAATDDLVAVFALARHLGNKGRDGIQGLNIQSLIEPKVIQIAARHLSQMDAACAERLVAAIEGLPGKQALRNMVGMEEWLWIDWHVAYANRAIETNSWDEHWMTTLLHFSAGSDLVEAVEEAAGGTAEGLLKLAGRERKYFQNAAELITLPHERFDTQWAALEEEANADNAPIAKFELEGLAACRWMSDQAQARRAMFKAAVAVVHRGGGDRLGEFKDPFGTGPFKYRALPEGFELQSELRNALQGGPKEKQDHVTLTVGPVNEK